MIYFSFKGDKELNIDEFKKMLLKNADLSKIINSQFNRKTTSSMITKIREFSSLHQKQNNMYQKHDNLRSYLKAKMLEDFRKGEMEIVNIIQSNPSNNNKHHLSNDKMEINKKSVQTSTSHYKINAQYATRKNSIQNKNMNTLKVNSDSKLTTKRPLLKRIRIQKVKDHPPILSELNLM